MGKPHRFGLLALTPTDERALHLALADVESGTPRQWWHLEMAARMPAGAVRAWVRPVLWLATRLGAGRSMPLLMLLGVRGLEPYVAVPAAPLVPEASHGARLSLCLLAVTLGLGTLNATRAFFVVLTAALGWALVVVRGGIRGDRIRREIGEGQQAIALEMTPSESALGLAGLMTAAGHPVDYAARLIDAACRQSGEVPASALASVGLLAPPASLAWRHAIAGGMTFCLGMFAVAWPVWFTSPARQTYPAVLCSVAVRYAVEGKPARWLRGSAADVMLAAACLLGGKALVHFLA